LLFTYDPGGKLPIQGLSEFSVSTNPVVIARDYQLTGIEEATNEGSTGRSLMFSYNGEGRITNIVCHTGADVPDLTVSYGYDTNGSGDLVSFTDVEGLYFPYQYDDSHQMTNFYTGGCTCLARGNVFDGEGRVIQQSIGNTLVDIEYLVPGVQTRVTTHVYDDDTLAFLRDRIEIFDFNPEGQVSMYGLQMGLQQDPGGGEDDDLVSEFLYNAATEELTQMTSPDGTVSTFTYDGADRLLTRTATVGGEFLTRHFAYDANGGLTNEYTSWSEQPGIRYNERQRTFDAQGRLTSETRIGTNAAELNTTYLYDTNGVNEVVTTEDPEGHRIRREFHPSGYLLRESDPDNPSRETLFGYDSRGNLTNRIDALGFETRWEYDAKGRVTREINALGHEDLFTYSSGNLVREETGRDGPAPGRVTLHEYDVLSRRIATYRLDDAGLTNLWRQLGYDSLGNVLYKEDPYGRRTSFTYDPADRVTQREDVYGSTTTNAYDKANRLISTINEFGVETRTGYHPLFASPTNRIEAVGTPVERTTRMEVEPGGRRIEVIPPAGPSTFFQYDEFGRQAGASGARVLPYTTEYDGNGRPVVLTDGNGHSTTNEYDAYGNATRTRYPDGAEKLFQFDDMDRQVSATDANGSTVYYSYDALGHRVAESLPNDSNTVLLAWTYTPWGEISTESNLLGATESSLYDRMGRRTNGVTATGLSLTYAYDSNDVLTTVFWPNGSYTSNTYDGARLIRRRDRAGITVSNAFDLVGNVTQQVHSIGLTNMFSYDELNRRAVTSNSLGQVTAVAYDVFSQPIRITHPDGLDEFIHYDVYGNVTNRAGAEQLTVSFGYDLAGNRTNLIDALGNETASDYDFRNRLVRKTYADGTFHQFGYDGSGSVTNQTDALGTSILFTYNEQYLQTAIDFPTDPDVSFEYDALGRPTRMIDGSGTNEWVYDIAGRLVTNVQSGFGAVLSYTYDQEGRRTTMSYNGDATAYEYDAAGRLTNINNHAGDFSTIWHPAAHRIVVQGFPGGAIVSNQYDALGQLLARSSLNSTGGVVSSFAYTYDPVGLATNVVHADGGGIAFAYDAARQLTEALGYLPGGMSDSNYQFTYQYDAMGNYTQVIRNAQTTIYAVNTLNQYTMSSNTGSSAVNYTFDDNGNFIDDGTALFAWDQNRHPIEVSNGTQRIEYEVSGLHRRVERRTYLSDALQDRIRYVYDGLLPIAEVDESNQLLRVYTMGIDMSGSLSGDAGGIGGLLAVSHVQGGVTNDTFIFGDGRGNVTDAIADDDTLAAVYRYDPFGNVVSSIGPLAAEIPMRFSSKPLDDVTGLYDFGLRQYDPALGRWISRDPIGESGGVALYRYASNNPIRHIDPFGTTVQAHPVVLRDPGFEAGDDVSDIIYEGEFRWDCDDISFHPGFYVVASYTPGHDLGWSLGSNDNPMEFSGLAHAYFDSIVFHGQNCKPPGCQGTHSGYRLEYIFGVRLYRCECQVEGWFTYSTRCACQKVSEERFETTCPCKKKSNSGPPEPSNPGDGPPIS
jgi:RHS repeat-associated protein